MTCYYENPSRQKSHDSRERLFGLHSSSPEVLCPFDQNLPDTSPDSDEKKH